MITYIVMIMVKLPHSPLLMIYNVYHSGSHAGTTPGEHRGNTGGTPGEHRGNTGGTPGEHQGNTRGTTGMSLQC